VRVNRPIHRIVEHISGNQSFTELNTGINELDFINKNVQKLIVENSRISEDQNMKDSLMKKYFYITKLKNIYTDFGEIKQYILNNKYFSLIYFIIHYKENFYRIGDDLNKATFFITKLIQSIVGGKYPESLTFQIELNKVVSIISFNRSSMDVCALENALLERLESENEYMFLTVVRGSVYKDISQISSAYNEIFHISNQRKLNQETQILTPESLQGEHNRFHLTNDHEKYFTNHLSNGEVDKCMDLVNRIIDINYHRDVRQSYFQRLSIYLVNKSVNIINSLKLNFSEPVDVETVYDQINKCSMVAHFKNLFAEFLPKISKPILEHRKSQDYIRNYVTEYIDRHYSEDIYLDLLADNLNITSNYLSQHFKLATGLCFKEHLNNIRMNRARELLLNTDKKIKEISHEVGYRNENTFIRSFKKINGSAPGEFRKQSNVRMKLDILVGSHPGGTL
jgi:AraC-like DNA-binding protein